MTVVPRLVLSAPSSGHGKTALAVGLLAALADRGLDVAGFKVGPGPRRRRVPRPRRRSAGAQPRPPAGRRRTGSPRCSRTAPPAPGSPWSRAPWACTTASPAGPETESTAAVAAALRSPVVLVVDVAAMGQSVAALVHGFRAYDEQLWLGGVILNRVASPRHEADAARGARRHRRAGLRRAAPAATCPPVLPSRRHGVVPVVAPRSAEATRGGPPAGRGGRPPRSTWTGCSRWPGRRRRWPAAAWSPERGARRRRPPAGGRVRWSRWPAGRAAATATPRRPSCSRPPAPRWSRSTRCATRRCPPAPGRWSSAAGCPRRTPSELSANRRLCIAVAELARAGRPVIAEGAGLLWLARELDGRPMCGVLDAVGASRDGLVVGYREATARTRQRGRRAGTRAGRAQAAPRGAHPAGRAAPGLELGRRRAGGLRLAAACTPRS